MKDPASDADPCRVRAVCQQQLGHRQAALVGGAAQRPDAAWKRTCDVVEDEPQRCGLPARDRVLDGCDVEDVDRRIRCLGKAGIGREHLRQRGQVAEECRGEDVLAGTCRQEQRLDRGAALQPGRAQRCHEYHPLECHPGDAHRKVEGMVRSDAAVQQHPHDLGAACQRGRLHDRRGVRRTQQVRRLRQRRAEPVGITTVSEVLRPLHAARADAAPGHRPRPFCCSLPRASFRHACSLARGPCRGTCPLTRARARERTCSKIMLRSSSAATVASIARRKCPSHRLASAGLIGRPSCRCSGLRGPARCNDEGRPATQRRTASASTGRPPGRAGTAGAADRRPRSPHTGGQPACRSSAGRRSARTDQSTERPEARRVIQQAAVLKTRTMRSVRPGHGRLRAGRCRAPAACAGRWCTSPPASCGPCLLPGGRLLLRHGYVHLQRDPAHPADERACLPDSG